MNRRSGRWFVILGVFGIVVGVATIAIGWILVGSGSDAFERSLDLSSDAIATVGDTVELADVTVESVMDALFTTESALGRMSLAVGDSERVVSEIAAILSEDLPASIEAARRAMPGVVAGAQVIDTTIRGLRFFGVDYDPEIPFPDAVRELDAALEGIPTELRRQGEVLGGFGVDVDSVVSDLGTLKGDLAELRLGMFNAGSLLADYERTVVAAEEIIADTKADLVGQRRLARTLVVSVGLVLIGLQAVPIYLGKQSGM